MGRKSLFPEIEPYRAGNLQVSPLHSLYFEEVGNPAGRPVVFLHGGPGAGINPKHRRFFDPDFYRIILFDQRGAGKSRPRAELKENTTDHLIADIEALRRKLGVDSWLVFGGSWGSTLALAYAIRHRDKVRGLVLRGIFLGTRSEVRWLFQEGSSKIFPEPFEAFRDLVPPQERGNLVSAYYRMLTSSIPSEQLRAAVSWSRWESSLTKLIPDTKMILDSAEEGLALSLARLECHYCAHELFLPEGYILNHASALAGVPTHIVHGRYDVVCVAEAAWKLHQSLPGSKMHFVPDAGHSATEPGMAHELVCATEDFKRLW